MMSVDEMSLAQLAREAGYKLRRSTRENELRVCNENGDTVLTNDSVGIWAATVMLKQIVQKKREVTQ